MLACAATDALHPKSKIANPGREVLLDDPVAIDGAGTVMVIMMPVTARRRPPPTRPSLRGGGDGRPHVRRRERVVAGGRGRSLPPRSASAASSRRNPRPIRGVGASWRSPATDGRVPRIRTFERDRFPE